jgi:hypothetical protein
MTDVCEKMQRMGELIKFKTLLQNSPEESKESHEMNFSQDNWSPKQDLNRILPEYMPQILSL